MEEFDFTEADLRPCPCNGTGFLDRAPWLGQEFSCTCGCADPDPVTGFHAVDCDSIPCPFDQLEIRS